MKTSKLPLGRETEYPQMYAPRVLCAISRAASRDALDLGGSLPFSGCDIWNAWELTWLDRHNRPRVATAEIRVPAESPNLVESKSLKLYLGSFAMTAFDSDTAVVDAIARDLAECAGAPVDVRVEPVSVAEARHPARLAGACLDDLEIEIESFDVDASLLHAAESGVVREDLHTHLLRSLCPVTSQPDIGSLQISYEGPAIDHAGLLRYVVSFRQHEDFHEACIERMFTDIMERCRPQRLTLQARYQRRGGIDINPVRTNCGETPLNLRLWRQ